MLVSETGWSWHDVLWRVNRSNLVLMMADRPRSVRGKVKPKKDTPKRVSGKELARMLKGK